MRKVRDFIKERLSKVMDMDVSELTDEQLNEFFLREIFFMLYEELDKELRDLLLYD